MAFSDAQIRDIRKYMGVTLGFYELNHRLESMIGLIGTHMADQEQIETWLTRLAEIDDALTGHNASITQYGSLKKVDEIEFHPLNQLQIGSVALTLVAQGRVLIGRIARAFGVSDYLPVGDYFGSKQPTGFIIPLG